MYIAVDEFYYIGRMSIFLVQRSDDALIVRDSMSAFTDNSSTAER